MFNSSLNLSLSKFTLVDVFNAECVLLSPWQSLVAVVLLCVVDYASPAGFLAGILSFHPGLNLEAQKLASALAS